MKTLVLSCFAVLASATLEASVYTFDGLPQTPARTSPPFASPETLRLVLSHRLGLSQHSELKSTDDDALFILNNFGGDQQPLLDSSEQSLNRLLLIIEGLENPQEFIDTQPSFRVTTPPTSSANLELVIDLLDRDRHRRGAETRCANEQPSRQSKESIQGGFSANDPLGTCMVHSLVDSAYNRMAPLEKLAIITADPLLALKSCYESPRSTAYLKDSTAIFHVSALEIIAREDGTDSKEYQETLERIKQLLSGITAAVDTQITIVLMPLQEKLSKRDSAGYGSPKVLEARQSRKEAPIPSPPTMAGSKPADQSKLSSSSAFANRTTIPTCWASKEDCMHQTTNCTSHGSCILKYAEKASEDEIGAECWACTCKPTVLRVGEKGKKTTYWGGPACQKKDVSVPFFLLAGFAIFIASAVAWGVGLLYSMGQESLPSVLAAGVAPTPRK